MPNEQRRRRSSDLEEHRRTADERLMRRAMVLAERGRGSVEPNPMVGCVIVHDGAVIAEGWHRKFGGPHAEIDALRRMRAGGARGATVYVTLEPCCYFGKTPPCVDALISAGVARVVVATRDPNPLVAGKGLKKLRSAGIEVSTGVLGDEGLELIAPFAKRMESGRPWVILKWAQSIDGKIAARSGDSKWISDAHMRRHAHVVRGRMDAILVGVRTVLADDPLLTARDVPIRRIAARVVLDTQLRTPMKSQLVRTAGQVPVILFTSRTAARQRGAQYVRAGCDVVGVGANRRGVSLPDVLDELGRRGMTNLLIEGGAAVHGSFTDAGLVDAVQVYIGNKLIGGVDASIAVAGVGARHMDKAWQLRDLQVERLGDGVLLQGLIGNPRTHR